MMLVKRLVLAARNGVLVHRLDVGAEIARRFLLLHDTDQEKFWANVGVETRRDNWDAGGPGDEEFAGNRNPRPKPRLLPPIFLPGNLSIEESLRRLGRVRVRRNEWVAFCPAHETHHYSLVISESKYKPGEPVFFCYAGCTHQQVKDKILAMRTHG